MSKIPKNLLKLMKIANFNREVLHIFWTTWGNSMKFSGKMRLIIILKVTKNLAFNLSLENSFYKKPQGRQEHFPLAVFLFNIERFYPSISLDFLNKAVKFRSPIIPMAEDDMKIIIQSREIFFEGK